MPNQGKSKLNDLIMNHVFFIMTQMLKVISCTTQAMVASNDVQFDDEANKNWETQEKRSYGFIPYFGEKDQEIITRYDSSTST